MFLWPVFYETAYREEVEKKKQIQHIGTKPYHSHETDDKDHDMHPDNIR